MHVKPIKLTDLLFFGGVASNKDCDTDYNNYVNNNIHLSIPSPKLCTDNHNDWCFDILLLSVRITAKLDLNGENNMDIEEATIEV